MTSKVDTLPLRQTEPARIIEWLRRHLPVTGRLLSDSRQIRAGDAFVALAGERHDGGLFAPQAVEQGAAALLYELVPPGHPYEKNGPDLYVLGASGFAGPVESRPISAFGADVPTGEPPLNDRDTVPRKSVGYARFEDGLFMADVNVRGTRVPGCIIPHLKAVLGPVADGWYGHPSRALTVMAVTGTNGKTSVTHWIADAINAADAPGLSPDTNPAKREMPHAGSEKPAQQAAGAAASADDAARLPAVVIGTNGAGVPGALRPVGLTTPDALGLQCLFHEFAGEGRALVAMEASSIGIAQGRMAGTTLHTAIFTNLTRDHLDYHGSMDAYGEAKARLFAWQGLKHAVINLDDPFAGTLLDVLHQQQDRPRIIGHHVTDAPEAGASGSRAAAAVSGAAVSGDAPTAAGTNTGVQARIARCDVVLSATPLADGRVQFALQQKGGANAQHTQPGVQEGTTLEAAPVHLAIVGRFNVSNVLAVAGALHALGMGFEDIVARVQALQPVPGRMEIIRVPDADEAAQATLPQVVVDYAHTPDALTHVLGALRTVAQARGGKLWCVFGAGGNRDRGKRPVMAAAVEALADHVVVTSDNPRSENPRQILDDVSAGLRRSARIIDVDRARAIGTVIAQADAADVVLVAGKGRERTQEIAGVFHPFSDPDVVEKALAARRQRGAHAEVSDV